ncbi:hypothetical protein [Dyadobacter sp. CY326]|uniref:hypothetical protein n=1 Tax=Dyadobacter sp. CY326 TaxID=2907300 RepID=UPI001F39F55B|nr:hypothetical protein [Dyadobacter sp. CY326]MCE7065192.1 hypothetical protein [Dyadobacter sp. CY326]
MKNINLISSLSTRLLKSAILIAMLTSTISFASSAAKAEGAIGKKHASGKHTKSLGQQISQLINVENTDLARLEKGIVIVSFLVNDKSQLTQVVSHSQIPATDLYLKWSLEGKKVEMPSGRPGLGQQFVKLRFSIDK